MGERKRGMHLKCVYTVLLWEIDWGEREAWKQGAHKIMFQ